MAVQKEGGVNKDAEKAAMQFCRSGKEILWRGGFIKSVTVNRDD